MPPAADSAPEFTAPDLTGKAALIVAAAEIESSLLARRLGGWGAETCVAAYEESAVALLAKRHWDALLVDYPLARSMIAHGDLARLDAARRIVLIRPTERHELPALKERGFTGYLVKPVRAASLAARLTAEDAFEDMRGGNFRCRQGATPPPPTAKALACRSWWPRTTRSTRCSRARC